VVAFTVADGEETGSTLTERKETIRKRAESLMVIAVDDTGPDMFDVDEAEPRAVAVTVRMRNKYLARRTVAKMALHEAGVAVVLIVGVEADSAEPVNTEAGAFEEATADSVVDEELAAVVRPEVVEDSAVVVEDAVVDQAAMQNRMVKPNNKFPACKEQYRS